jgi:hypothetical protein
VLRNLVQREGTTLTFRLTLSENGVRRDAFTVSVEAGLGAAGIRDELKRAARQRVRAIAAEAAAAQERR